MISREIQPQESGTWGFCSRKEWYCITRTLKIYMCHLLHYLVWDSDSWTIRSHVGSRKTSSKLGSSLLRKWHLQRCGDGRIIWYICCAMTHAVVVKGPLTMEARDQSKVSQSEICGRLRHWNRFPSKYFSLVPSCIHNQQYTSLATGTSIK
jgi:hypothetical protein